MLDIKFIREHKDLIQAGAKKKHLEFNVDDLITIDDERKKILAVVEKKRTEQNEVSQKIVQVSDPAERNLIIAKMKMVKDEIQVEEEKLKEVMKNWQQLMVKVPNIPDISVPEGVDDSGNVEVRTWGEIPKFDFTPKDHVELMESLDMVDFERGARVSGFRGYFLKNEGAELSFAIWNYLLEEFHKKGGFTPMITPLIVKRETLMGSGYLPQGEEDLYKTQDGDFLTGTAEVPTMSYYADEVVDKSKLPIKFFSFSPCLRREAGSHGKDTKGIMRVHEFYKFEQVVLCEASHEESVKHHEELTLNAEKIIQGLGLPYHVVINCGGDLGLGQVKKYDIECWVPSENKYRETHSSSYFHDFQTRRLNIRYKDSDGKLKFTHSLNNTAIATPRVLISIIENNQQADGSIKIPEVLQKWMGGRKVISKK
ncbi:MAG: serine--tRNA ligase [Candidatus Paceibacterota bacterium]